MNLVRVTVTGTAEVRAYLQNAGVRLTAGTVPSSLAAGNVIAEKARENIRSSPSILSGDLLDSIEVVQGRGIGGLFSATAEVIVDQWYAHFVEFGTVNMPAEPFLRPAADEGEAEAVAAIAAVLRAAIA